MPPDAVMGSEEPKQMVGLLGLKLTDGNVFTFTDIVCVFSQPFIFEFTVYVLLFDGEAYTEAPVFDDKSVEGLQEYAATAPKLFEAVKRTESPKQIEGLRGFTVKV